MIIWHLIFCLPCPEKEEALAFLQLSLWVHSLSHSTLFQAPCPWSALDFITGLCPWTYHLLQPKGGTRRRWEAQGERLGVSSLPNATFTQGHEDTALCHFLKHCFPSLVRPGSDFPSDFYYENFQVYRNVRNSLMNTNILPLNSPMVNVLPRFFEI